MRIFQILFAAMVFMLSLTAAGWAGRHAPPGQQCTVETTTIASVTIGNINKAPDMSNILSFSCQLSRAIDTTKYYMAYCWHIHDAPSGTARFTYRYATLGTGSKQSKIGFNIYSNGLKVGDRRTLNNIIGYPKKVNDTLYRVDDPMTVRFEGNEGTSPGTGKYKYNNPKTHVTMYMIDNGDVLDYRNACGSSNGDIIGREEFGDTLIDVNVRTYCDVSVGSDMTFPKQYTLRKGVTAQAQIVVNCSAGTDYKVTLDNGQNYADNSRHMKLAGGGHSIAYNLTPESWTDLGTSFDQPFTVNGEVPAQDTPPGGAYRDTVVVTVNIIQ